MRLKHFLSVFLTLLTLSVGQMWADTYEQLTSIANIDESAEYVLGIDGTGFHYSGTSSWGLTALPSAQTPLKYSLKIANDEKSFTAETTIGNTKYYLQVPTSNTFSMATSTGTNTDLIIGTTQVSGTNYAVANKTTTARHLRINGTSGLRSYAGTTGTMAFFYKVVSATPCSITWHVNGNTTTAGNPTTNSSTGSKVTKLPTSPISSDCDGSKVFVGWTATEIAGTTSTAPADLFTTADESPTLTGNTNFYAVFATASAGQSSSKTYNLQLTGSGNFVQSYDERSSNATANEVGGTGKYTVGISSTGVMKSSNSGNPIQFRKSSSGAGVLYNTTNLGTINSITYGTGSTNNIASTYKGTSVQPSSDGTGGYFKITNGSSVSYITSITINFTIEIPGETTYSAYATSCCTELGSIKGSVSETQPEDYDKKTVEWTIPVDGSSQKKAAGAILKLYADNNNAKGAEITAKKADYSSDNNTTSHTFEGLDPETKYWFTITLIGRTASGVTYCDSEEGTAVSFTTKAAVNTWTITYNANGENVTNMPDATYAQKSTGEGTLSSTVPVRAGYTFLGWDKVDDASDATYAAGAAITDVDDDLDLYAIWERRDVTLVVGSGSVTSSTLVPDGEGKVLLPSATPSEACTTLNWKFIGWAEAEATGTKPATIIPASEYTPAAKKTLYAVYGELGNTYTKITSGTDFTTGNYVFAILSGKALNNTISNKTTAGTTVTISDNSITDPDAAAIWLVTKSGDNYTLYNAATEGDNKYLNIIADGKYGQLASESTSANYTAEFTNSGDILLKSASITNQLIEYFGQNSVFQSWNSANTAIYAFKQDYSSYETTPNCVTYTLSSEVETDNTDETSSVSIVKSVLKEAEETKATATPKDGYRFLHWTISGTGAAMSNTADGKSTDNPVTVTMGTANATITAYFEKIPSHKVYFYNGTTLLNGENGTDVLEGGAVAYSGATPESCDEGEGASLTFAGWTTAKWTGKIAKNAITVNTFYEGELPEMGEDDVTYYAVFCKNNEASALFEWEGGSSAGLTAAGATISGNDTDYKDHSPYYVKLDGTGDYIQILTSAAIGSVAIGVKMVGGGNTSSITVQESTNGSNFTDVQTLTISGSQNDILNLSTTNAFASTSRVVRLYFTKGSNIGVGPITVMGVAPANSNYMTTCLLDMGGINGTVGLSQLTSGDNAGKLQASWDEQTDQTGWANEGLIIKIYKDGETPTLVHTSVAQDQDKEGRSYVWGTAPDYCSEYYATLTPVKKDNSYKDGVEQGKSASNCAISGQYSYTPSYSHVAPKAGETVAENSCSSFSVEYEGTDGYSLPPSVTVNGVTPYSWENGVLSFDKANVTGNVTITINGVEPAAATLSTTESALAFGTPQQNADVAAQKFRISGVALSAGTITITSPNAGFTVSPESIEVAAGNLEASEATEITVTPVTSAVGVFDGNITISGGGASTTVALTMEVKEVYTVNWYVNGTIAHTQEGVSGMALTDIPNDFTEVTDCSEKVFKGWTETANYSDENDAPADLITSTTGMKITAANKDYYAVFADKNGGDDLTGTLTESEIQSHYTTASHKYSDDAVSYSDGDITWNAIYNVDAVDRPWIQFNNTAYLQITAPKKITQVKVIVTSTQNKSGGILDKTNYNAFSSAVTLSLKAATNAETSVGSAASNTTDSYQELTLNVTSGNNTSLYLMSSGGYRLWRVTVTYADDPEYSNYVTVCPHVSRVTLSAPEVSNGSISFEQSGSAVTNVRTDGGDAVEVDVIASLDEGYELTGLTLTSEDVTGATKNEALTKITIPAGEEGTLTVTPTITLIPKYSITFAKGDEAVTGSDPETIDPQYAGTPITLPTNTYEWTNHKFDAWKVTYVDANEQIQEVAVSDNSFEMPAANVTITAQWIEIANSTISFQVNGIEVATANAPQEQEYNIPANTTHPTVIGFTFLGWSKTEYADEVEELPAMITSFTPEAGENNITLYGIYSRLDDSDVNYGKYEKATAVAEGDYLIVCESENKVFDGSLTTLEASSNNKSASVSNGVLTLANAESYVFTIAAKTGGYSIKSASNKYIGHSGSSNALKESATDTYTNSITISEGNVTITCNNYKLQYNKSSGQERFRYFSGTQTAIQLYKKNEGTMWYTSSPVEKVTVTFDLADGEGGCQTTKINKGGELTICIDVPTKLHSEFLGWKNGDDVYVAGTAYTFDADITLTAQWNTLPTYTITYDVNGSSDATPTQANQYAGDQFAVAAAVAKDGYTFKGWEYNNKLYKAGKTFTMPAANVEFVANWKKDAVATEKMNLITEASALVDGLEFALGCSYGESNFAMAGDLGSNSYFASASGDNITLSNGLASFTSDVIILIAEKTEDGWKLRKDATNYLKETSQKNLAWGTSADATVWTISFSEGNVLITNASNNVLLYNYQSPRFTTYGGTSNVVVNIQMFSKATVVSSPDNNPVNISDLGNVSGETVIVTSGTTLVANEASAPEALVIQEGAKYVATAQTTTPVVHFSVTMGSENPAGDETTASELEKAFNIILTTGGEIHYDITLGTSMAGVQADPNQWHAFTVPFSVDVLNGIYNAETGAKLTNEVDYAIMDYHGDIRANGQYGWKKFRGTLVPGTFYIMTVNGDVKTFRFKKVATGALPNNTSMGFTAYGVTDPDNTTPDQGWNGIGNPSWLGCKVEYNVQVLDPYSYTFVTKTANSTNFKPGTPFFYKASSDGEMNMLEANASANYAPARTPANEIKNVAVTFGNEVFRDKLYISASEDALSTYENDKDLVKMTMTNTPSVAQIFGKAYNTKLCMVYAPLSNDQAVYDLTLYAPQAGEYTIAAPSMDNADLYLTYEGSIIWNLSMNEYVADFAKGNNEGYGLLLVRKAPNAATGVEDSVFSDQSSAVQKVIIDEHVYILRGGQMYDVNGKMVK